MKWNRIVVLCAATACVLAVAALVVPRLAGPVRGLFAPKSYDWVSKTMAACEEDAVTQPSSVNFLVVPLEPSRRFGKDLEAKAIETFGPHDVVRVAGRVERAEIRRAAHFVQTLCPAHPRYIQQFIGPVEFRLAAWRA